jgi:hypothetical protein
MKAKWRTLLDHTATIIIFASLFTAATFISSRFMRSWYSPVAYYTAVTDRPEYFPGEHAIVNYTLQRTETCPADIDGFWIRANGQVAYRAPRVPGGYTIPSPKPTIVPVDVLVPELAPGRYAYRAVVTSYCHDGTYSAITPDAWILVRERGR